MMTDDELQRAVLDELKWEPSVNPADIGVTVKHGVVTLSGHVPSFAEEYAAEKAAKRVRGVKAVADELKVKLPVGGARTDEDIAAATVKALKSNTLVPADRIKVAVSRGWLKLEGAVEWQFQKDAAASTVRNLPGVVGVSNLIAVTPKVRPEDVRTQIEDALRRSALVSVRRVRAEVRGNKIILHGRIRSWSEREKAERVAWSVPGVSQVENYLVVTREKPTWVKVAVAAATFSLLAVTLAWPALLLHDWLRSSSPQEESKEVAERLNQLAVSVSDATAVGLLASPGGAGPLLATSTLFPGGTGAVLVQPPPIPRITAPPPRGS